MQRISMGLTAAKYDELSWNLTTVCSELVELPRNRKLFCRAKKNDGYACCPDFERDPNNLKAFRKSS
jgi:hypothetical protein